jgi:hypothetical protein
MRAATGAGPPIPSPDQLEAFLEWWLDVQEAKAQSGKKSTNTIDQSRWSFNNWTIPALGRKRLRELEPEDVEAVLARAAKAGMARHSLVHIRFHLG